MVSAHPCASLRIRSTQLFIIFCDVHCLHIHLFTINLWNNWKHKLALISFFMVDKELNFYKIGPFCPLRNTFILFQSIAVEFLIRECELRRMWSFTIFSNEQLFQCEKVTDKSGLWILFSFTKVSSNSEGKWSSTNTSSRHNPIETNNVIIIISCVARYIFYSICIKNLKLLCVFPISSNAHSKFHRITIWI